MPYHTSIVRPTFNRTSYSPSQMEAVESTPSSYMDCDSTMINQQPPYPIISAPWNSLDSPFMWPYNDPVLWAWAAGNYPLLGYRPAFPNYNGTGSWTMNPGQVGRQPVGNTSHPPLDILPSTTTPIDEQPAIINHDVIAVEESRSRNDRHADNEK